MSIGTAADRRETMPSFYCELCKVRHIGSDDNPIVYCCHCARPLCPMYDWSCISCGRAYCDNACQSCQEDDCDAITCIGCVDRHLAKSHPPEAVAL